MAVPAVEETNAIRPTVAVIATVHWASTTRLCLALAEGGFRVLALVPDHHALRRLRPIETALLGRTRAQAMRRIGRLLAGPIDMVVPADERAIDLVHTTYAAALARRDANHRRLAELIESSLGSDSA